MGVVSKRIEMAWQHLLLNDFENALIHICIATDATSKKNWPKQKPGQRIRKHIKEYEALIYQCASGGRLKVKGKIILQWGELPDIMYKLIRCVLLHGDNIHDYVDIRHSEYVIGVNQGRFILPSAMILGLFSL